MRQPWALLLPLLLAAGGTARADRQPLSIAVSWSEFFPAGRAVRRTAGSTWAGIGISPFTRHKREQPHFDWDITFLQHAGAGRLTLVPVTVGVEKAFTPRTRIQPYVSLRGGPYYGHVRLPDGDRSSAVGFDANATLGVTFRERFFLEARYDYYSRFSGLSASGPTISAGVRLFDIRL